MTDQPSSSSLPTLSYYLEFAARIYVWIMMNIYGLGKIAGKQFARRDHFPEKLKEITLEDASGFELAWTFFGYSNGYIWFIGLSQVIGAWLLLSERTKLLGVAILLPVLINIVIVDAAFGIPYAALGSALTYLILVLLIIFWNRKQAGKILKVFTEKEHPIPTQWGMVAVTAIVVFCIMLAFAVIERMIVWRLLAP